MTPFGPYLPDLEDFQHPGVVRADNVYPSPTGYKPTKTFTNFATALGGLGSRPYGAFRYTGQGGLIRLFAATATNLYVYVLTDPQGNQGPGTRIQVSRTTGAYNGPFNRWSFALFKEKLLAVNGSDIVQHYNARLDLTTGTFADIANAPQFYREITTVGDFVVLSGGQLFGAVSNRNTIHWSGFDDWDGWEPGTNQSDTHTFDDETTTTIGGQHGIVFMPNQIWRMTYVGVSQGIFQFDQITDNLGTIFPRGIVKYDRYIWFINGGSVFELMDGTTIREIGRGKIDSETVILLGTASTVEGAYDAISNKVIWAVGADASTDKARSLIYDPQSGNFSVQLPPIHTLVSSYLTRYLPYVYGISAAGFIYKLDGAAPTAYLETGEFGGNDTSTTMEVRPYIQGNSSTVINVYVGSRNKLTDTVTWTDAVQPDSMGKCNFRAHGRFVRLGFQIVGGFDHAIGYDVTPKFAGKR